jgi:hypothetical protein
MTMPVEGPSAAPPNNYVPTDEQRWMEDQHKARQAEQMFMIDMQQRFAMDQFEVTTKSNIGKAASDTLKGISSNMK